MRHNKIIQYWGDIVIVIGVLLMIVGLRVKLADNLKEKEVKILKAEQKVVGKININSATIRELVDLPAIGEVMAQRIIDYRQSVGKFKNKEQLKNVSGIGDKTYENLKNKIDL